MQRKCNVNFALHLRLQRKKTAGTVQPAARRTHEQTMYLRAAGPAAPTVPIYTLLFLPGTAYFIQPELEQRIILANCISTKSTRYGTFDSSSFSLSIQMLDAIFSFPSMAISTSFHLNFSLILCKIGFVYFTVLSHLNGGFYFAVFSSSFFPETALVFCGDVKNFVFLD